MLYHITLYYITLYQPLYSPLPHPISDSSVPSSRRQDKTRQDVGPLGPYRCVRGSAAPSRAAGESRGDSPTPGQNRFSTAHHISSHPLFPIPYPVHSIPVQSRPVPPCTGVETCWEHKTQIPSTSRYISNGHCADPLPSTSLATDSSPPSFPSIPIYRVQTSAWTLRRVVQRHEFCTKELTRQARRDASRRDEGTHA
ncbi:hypothetical protein JHW43_005790 [Diplocarpon mali]|nr:hypothetical protein JHW43_005790 [Diplocarpon mali]